MLGVAKENLSHLIGSWEFCQVGDVHQRSISIQLKSQSLVSEEQELWLQGNPPLFRWIVQGGVEIPTLTTQLSINLSIAFGWTLSKFFAISTLKLLKRLPFE